MNFSIILELYKFFKNNKLIIKIINYLFLKNKIKINIFI